MKFLLASLLLHLRHKSHENNNIILLILYKIILYKTITKDKIALMTGNRLSLLIP